MRVVFFGTSEFAVPTLKALPEAGHTVLAVVTPSPRLAGRGRRLVPTPVHEAAEELKLTVLSPDDPNDEDFCRSIAALSPDIGVLVAYGYILKERLLDIPVHGFVNLHPSPLPRYRGAAPLQHALLNGDTETAITVIRMNSRVDAGEILSQLPATVEPDETCGDLSARLAVTGAQLVNKTLAGIADETIEPRPQDRSLVTRARKVKEEDRLLKWTEPAIEIHNRIRALSPEPAAFGFFHEQRLLVYRSKVLPGTTDAQPGAILQELPGFAVATGDGILELTEVKMEGGKLLDGTSFRNGARFRVGAKVE